MFSTMGNVNKPPAPIRWPPSTTRSDMVRLHMAVLLNKPRKIVKYIKRGTSVNIYNQDGQTPLFCAAMLGRAKIVKKLLKLGGDPNARCSKDGSTPVHAAAYIGCTECLKLLLVSGGDLRLTDGLLRTPLDWTNLQMDDFKQQNIKRVMDGARLCAFKSNGMELISECETRLGTKSGRLFSFTTKKFSSKTSIMGKYQHSELMLKHSLIPFGYGKVYYGTGQNMRCGAVIGLPLLNGIADLKLDSESESASWICGKYSTYVPMEWVGRKTSVTVRELRKSTVTDAITDLLIAELNSLTTIQHPNILMLLAVCFTDNYDSISLVFEKVPLGSLHFLLHNKLQRLSSRSVIEIIMQICEALEFLHASGYIHGFVNSHAIFLITNSRAKLGCCEYMTPIGAGLDDVQRYQHPLLRSDSHLTVHRHWVAPEIISQRRRATKSSDVYSVCCVMWELIYGEVPWKDCSVEALRIMMTENPYAKLPLDKEIVPPLWYHVMKMGLEPEAPMRDLDLSEVRDMMILSRNALDVESGDGDHNRKAGSNQSSLKVHDNPVVTNRNTIEDGLLSLYGPQTAV